MGGDKKVDEGVAGTEDATVSPRVRKNSNVLTREAQTHSTKAKDDQKRQNDVARR